VYTQTACASYFAGPCDGSVDLRSLIADGRIRSQASTSGICGEQSDIVTVSASSSIHSTNGIPMGQDSSVGIATRYGLDGPGIESQWRRDFLHPSRPSLGPIQPPVEWGPGIFTGGKAAGPWR